MAVTIKHAKTDTIADWTQSDLDAQIAAGNYPAGTVLADIVLPSDWNNDHTISGTVPIANGGTGETTANAAINALLPSQSSNVGKVLTTDGTNTSWQTNGTGTVTSVTGTAPVSVATGTTTPVISMAAATGSVNGYLTSTDWTTFNGKAPATSGTSILYGNGSGGFSNVTVGSGITFAGGTLSATGTGGDVVGPASATDNAIARYNLTTGKLIQNSVVTIDDDGNMAGADSFKYSGTPPTGTITPGTMWFDASTETLNFQQNNITQQIGEETFIYGRASEAITNGQVVAVSGAYGTTGYVTFEPAPIGTTDPTHIIGLATEDIAKNSFGRVTCFGIVHDLSTSPGFADGDALWYDPTVVGGYTKTQPVAPNIKVQIGVVTKAAGGTNGSIQVKVFTGPTINDISNIQTSSSTGGQLLTYNATGGYWKNTSLSAGTGITVSPVAGGGLTVTNSAPDQTVSITGAGGAVVTGTYPSFTITTPSGTVTSVTGTAPIASTGGATPAISISQATTSTNGYLSSTDWNTFNNKQPAGTYVTSVSATSPVTSSGGTTPTIAMPAATGSVSGYLTSTDWTTFNNKGSGTVTSVTGTAPVVSSGGATPAISMAAANTTTNGYLTSTDWNTFNGKGSGSVTSVSVVSANGFAGTVATATTTPAITLTTSITGILKGNGTAISAATAGTDYVVSSTATTFTAPQTFNGSSSTLAAVFANAAETTTVSATAATGTINYDVTTQSVLYYTTNASANFTLNFRASSGTSLNTAMATGQTVTVVFLCTNGATAYYNNAVQVDGASVTPKYQGGSAWTSGNASGIDAYSFTIIKTGSAAFTVLTSLTQFK